MSVELLTEQHLEFLSLKGSCAGSSESALVKMPHCWKSHVAAHMLCLSSSHSRRWLATKICYVYPVAAQGGGLLLKYAMLIQ